MSDGERAPHPPTDADAGNRLAWEEAVRRIRRREHALETLMQLSQSLTASSDLYEQVDSVLFGAMGQLGTSRSALWVVSPDLGTLPALLRCHGFRRSLMLGFGSSVTTSLLAWLESGRRCVTADELARFQDSTQQLLTTQGGIAAVALVRSAEGPLGLVTVGSPLDREHYDAGDLQLLETAVGLIGMAVSNARLHGDLAESNRVLRNSNQAMEHLDRMKSEFLANVNHELRTPLTVIRASLDLLRDPQTAGNTPKVLAMAMDASNRLQSLVENLLTFSALEQDFEPGALAPVNVAEVLATFHRDRMPGIAAGLRELSLACPADLPPALADAEGLGCILDQLVMNSVKFTPRGTRIELSASRVAGPQGDEIAIQVSDDGPGIPDHRAESLFRVFENGGASQPERPGGIGLGLPLASRLAGHMGGRLELDSRLGEGTRFTIRLRIADRRRAADDAASAEAA